MSALQLYRRNGIPLESQYPYVGSNSYYRSRNSRICSETNTVKLNFTTLSLSHYSRLTE
jgi:hypothetical protein